MDDADRAQIKEQQFLSDALAGVCASDDSTTNDQDGLCDDCGDAIEPGRLAAKPNARRCVSCQQEHEQRLSQYRRGV